MYKAKGIYRSTNMEANAEGTTVEDHLSIFTVYPLMSWGVDENH